jgi:2-methylcitrate dehydratase PrpD
MDATQSFAEFTHELTLDALPETSVEAAARMALDTVGATLAAWDAPGIPELRHVLSKWGTGPSRVWVGGEGLSPGAATLVNSAMAHALEYDDLHCDLPMHCGGILVPVVLAVADAEPGVTGAEACVALVAGTEVMCRMARATNSYFGDAGFRVLSSPASAPPPQRGACSGSTPTVSRARWGCPMPRPPATSNVSPMAGWSNACSPA